MKTKLTLKKETLHVVATQARRDGANDPKPPTSLTTHWTQTWGGY